MNERTSLPLPPTLEAKLADFRRRVWIIKLLEGLLAAIFGLALSYALVFALDRFFDTPGWVRGVLLVAGASVLGLGLPLKWHRWVWKQRRLEDAARLLRQKMPRLGDQLLGIVELARMDASTGRSERLVQAAMAQAAEAVKDIPFEQAVPQDRHRPWGIAAGAGVAVAILAFFVVPAAAWNALARWLTPWKEIERYTFAKIEALPKRLVIPYAEPADLKTALAKDTEWSPQSGAVKIQEQPAVKAGLSSNGYDFKLPPQKQNAPLDLRVGDLRKTIDLVPTQRPELKTLQARLVLPEYLQYTTRPVIEARSGTLSLVKGAQASFELTASRELAAATMDGQPQPIEKGRVVTTAALVKESALHVFSWKDADGLAARDPLTLKIQAVDDDPPRVLARRDSQEQVVLESEVVAFDLEVTDDFGVKRTGLTWKGLPGEDGVEPAKGESVSGAGAPEKRELNVRATFSAQRDGVRPQSLEIKAWAEDYLPGRERSHSPVFLIHVMSKDDHAIWMTEQFGKWLQASRETYEHEQRLHETNQELRAMSPEELDRPENRRKVAQQASAESANGDRLNRLNDAGRKLIEQAARNDAFDAKRLENWAAMLKSLKDIAGKRMPNVADLLKQSAAEKASQGLAKGQPAEKGEQQVQAGQPSKPGEQKGEPSVSPKESKQGEPSKGSQGSKPQAPQVSQGEPAKGGGEPPKPQDPNARPPPPAPGIADNEAGHFKKTEAEPEKPPGKPSTPGGGKLGLPETTLASPPKKPVATNKPKDEDAPPSPAQKKLDGAISEQKELLEAFAKATDQLRELLASLEASTFVKRLKSASKKQMAISTDLNAGTLAAFGQDKRKVAGEVLKKATDIATREVEQSSVIRIIQADLEAYFQRKQDQRFKTLLEQMKKTEVVAAVARIGDEVKGNNWSGRGISASEFWADTLDRWAEEMVGAAEAGDSKGEAKPQDSLPPEIVLKVMQALHDEMALRDETREAENGKPAMEKKDYFKRATGMAVKQDDIGRRTYEAAQAISKLSKAQSFRKEMKLLSQVTEVMGDAYKILDKPDTSAPAVAAETEAIELLLETRRQPPGGGGGGGGSSPGGGGSAAAAQSAALAEIGPGADPTAKVSERETGQATGKAGHEYPDEFKTGLDAYFNALEKGAGK
ncbi:MAG: hypothetical protein JWO94_2062 [Verrucomicrobiaceae bacterium]|nr:hypothetical protein [Verrucomicrobiaceae bacterium]